MHDGNGEEPGRARAADAARRRHATWAGAVAGLAVVGIAVGAAYVPRAVPGGFLDAASGQEPETASTGTRWPNGQADRTATSGPRADKSVAMAPGLTAALPSGLRAVQEVEGLKAVTQSQFADYTDDGREVWEYLASSPVMATDGGQATGVVFVRVTTAGGRSAADPCGATASAPDITGTCAVVDVDGRQVGVLTSQGAKGIANWYDQVAAYRYEDGTVVLVGQARTFRDSKLPELPGQPLTEARLAAVATDPAFHLD